MKILISFLCLAGSAVVTGQTGLPIYYNISGFLDQTIGQLGFLSFKKSDVTYQLWTRNQTSSGVPLTPGGLNATKFIRRSNVFKFITHGYLDSARSKWMSDMKYEYLIKDDYNVVLVDWLIGAIQMYPVSARYTKIIGGYIGEIWKELNRTMGVPFGNIHCIGHSLGAHICGFAGKYVRSLGRTIGRISGCDPAGPLFYKAVESNRLNKSDAAVIDVYHTDGTMYGNPMALGHYDFYINAGVQPQPGCYTFDRINDVIFGCSHKRSCLYFIESINSFGFLAKICASSYLYYTNQCRNNSYAVMGEQLLDDPYPQGLYQISTNANPPYARQGTI